MLTINNKLYCHHSSFWVIWKNQNEMNRVWSKVVFFNVNFYSEANKLTLQGKGFGYYLCRYITYTDRESDFPLPSLKKMYEELVKVAKEHQSQKPLVIIEQLIVLIVRTASWEQYDSNFLLDFINWLLSITHRRNNFSPISWWTLVLLPIFYLRHGLIIQNQI